VSPSVARVVDAAMEATVAPSFARLGATVRASLVEWPSPPDGVLDGRVCVVTGASSGIGAALARGLAGAGADLHLVGRDPDALARVADDVRRLGRASKVTSHVVDLGDLGAVRRLAADLSMQADRVDVLAHVAGALVHERTITDDGVELTLQVHVVAPFLLTHLLLPKLDAADRPRVITMSSGGMYTQRLDVDTLEDRDGDFDGTKAYARAKRAQVALNEEWARRHPRGGIGFHALHPGWVDTPGLRTSLPGFARGLRRALRTPEQGADTALWLAWTPDATAPGGDFWHDRRRRHTTLPWTSTPAGESERLWDHVAELAGVATPAPNGEEQS
jgi:dehydrogenase/reductase SDR family member 12